MTENYFDYTRRCRNYDPFAYGQWQMDYAAMLDRVFGLRGHRVLDIGCAGGASVKAMVDCCGADAFGCDVNSFGVTKTPFVKKRRRLQVAATDRLTDYYAKPFTRIHSSQVFEHFPDQAYSQRVLSECRRLLTPEGILFISLVVGNHLTLDQLSQKTDEDQTHINIWPMDWWRCAAREAGFKDVTAVYLPQLWADPMQQRYNWDWLILS